MDNNNLHIWSIIYLDLWPQLVTFTNKFTCCSNNILKWSTMRICVKKCLHKIYHYLLFDVS